MLSPRYRKRALPSANLFQVKEISPMFPSTTTSTHNAPHRADNTSEKTEHGLFSRFPSVSFRACLVSNLKMRLLLMSLLGLAIPFNAYAQVLYGSLTGNVTDPAGAVVTGAKVEALNIGTGVLRATSTDESGLYRFSDLQAGVYKVTIAAGSFKTQVQDQVRVNSNASRRLDVQLQVADVSGSVLISSQSEALQTDRADINITQSTRQVNDLPLTGSLGRNYQSLMV